MKKLTVIGVGLLGGSVALAAKSKGLARQIWGFGVRPARIQRAKRQGLLSHASSDLRLACADADLIVLATPFTLFESYLRQIAVYAPASCLVTDLGSVKGDWVAHWEAAARPLNFVASHPMAGSEKTGYEHASTSLFKNAPCIVTPTPRTNKAALKAVEAFWSALGAKVYRRSPAQHDRIIGHYSHLSHAAAFALASSTAKRMAKSDAPLAGPSYRGATRVASSDAGLWLDIFNYNRQAVASELDAYLAELKGLRGLLKPGREASLKAWLKRVTLAARKERGV